MKLGERTVHNAVFNAASSVAPLVLSLVFWPYILGKLGDASYGVFALVGTVIGYFALLDLGLGNAVVKYVAEYAGQQDTRKVNDVIGTAQTIFLVLGFAGLLMILALAWPLATVIMKVPPELKIMAFRCFCAASLGFFFTMLLTLYNAVINGMNRYDLTSVVNAVMGAVTTIGAFLLLYAGFDLFAVVLLNVVIPLLTVVACQTLIRRHFAGVRLRPAWDRGAVKKVVHYGMYALLSRVTDVIVRQVDILIIGALLGVSAVTYYVIPFTVLNRMTALIGRIGMVVFPAVSELQGQLQKEKIDELYVTATRVIFILASAFCVPLFIFGTRFLTLWMSPEFAAKGSIAMHLITIAVYTDLCTNVPTFVTDGLGKPQVTGISAITHAVIFLGLTIPMALALGINGVAGAFALSAILVAPFYISYVNRKVVRISTGSLLRAAYLRPALAAAATALVLYFIPQQKVNNIFLLLALMGAGSGVYLGVALGLGAFGEHETRVLREYADRLWRKFRGEKLKS
ncbi:MAG: oligosaccharide flippase family protein [Lentisphaerota bacterium]